MALLKYELKCMDEENCGRKAIVLVDPEEPEVPHICPFCGADAVEVVE
jgi:hypothetical protein